jgi:serine/threonine protein kinase
MAEPEQPTVGLETLGRYRLLQRLGRGGMATVFLAQDMRLDRQVAVKILPPECVNDPAAIARFEREAKALAQLSHPGIVQAYDSDAAQGKHFLVMEYVNGVNLSDLLKQRGPLPPTMAADYIHQAAEALAHAHKKGLIHRDLKPSNLLLTADGRVKLLDLGLARFLQDQVGDPELTREGAGLGTPDYAAPEQFRDAHHADERSDIYSLGCTLYHLLAGQVPFPGSSLQEKMRDHEHREPPPLDQLCPQAPAGLVIAVSKMMAKRPEDRFKSVREVADALAGNVASSSPSFQALKNTLTWQPAQSTLPLMPARKYGLLGALAGATLACALLVGIALIWQATQSGPEVGNDPGPLVKHDGKDPARGSGKEESNKKVVDPKKEPDDQAAKAKAALWEDPDVLTVAQDGSAKFTTITAALDQIRPGQTIRVLDDKDYAETLMISRGTSQRDIKVEAVNRARLLAGIEGRPAILINGVAGVTVRGFRIRAEADRVALAGVLGRSPGAVLDRLEGEGTRPNDTGIEVFNAGLAAEDPPVVIQNCTIHKVNVGIIVDGITPDYRTSGPCNRVIVRDNLIVDCFGGLRATGLLTQVQLTGNRLVRMQLYGIQLEQLHADAADILVANNTMFACGKPLRLWDSAVKGRVQIRNNLLLDCSGTYFMFVDSGGEPDRPKGPGDGTALHKAWTISHNWTEVADPLPKSDVWLKSLVPPGADEILLPKIEVLSRDPQSLDFLRPAKDSPLAREGAGKSDSSLPIYIGAMPPPGTAAWDWSRTWLASPPGLLLTVSKDKKTGGKYRTLNEALAAARPWATIRMLDGETYAERLLLDDPDKHTGLMIEAPAGAVLASAKKGAQLVTIKNVPHVRVRGLRLRPQPDSTAGVVPCILVFGRAPGTVLEALDLSLPENTDGIMTRGFQTTEADAPLLIRVCHIKGGARGIGVLGPVRATKGFQAVSGVVVDGNHVEGSLLGMLLGGQAARVQVTSNLVRDCRMAGLQVEDLGDASSNILFANNTVFDSANGFRIWSNTPDPPRPGQVTLAANIFFGGDRADVSAFESTGVNQGTGSTKLADAVAGAWRFAGNWRDLSTTLTAGVVPLDPADYKLETLTFVSRKPGDADFMRPTSDFFKLMHSKPLPVSLRLPPYAGAVPPKGVEAWDWRATWDALRLPRTAETE